MKKILIVRFSSLGDVVLTTPLPANLKARWPDAQVHVLTKAPYVDVFKGNPAVDRVIAYDPSSTGFGFLAQQMRTERYDAIIDLQANVRSWLLRMIAGPKMVSVVEKANWARRKLVLIKRTSPILFRSVRERNLDTLKWLEAPVMSDETQLFTSNVPLTLKNFGISDGMRLTGIAPGAKHATKRWPAARFAEAANRMGAFPNSMVVLLGDKHDEAVCAQVASQLTVPFKNLAGRTSLEELKAVVSKLSFLITNDSGILHMAEAFKIPLVALFGPTVRAFGFAPYRKTSRVVEVALNCRPCTLHGDPACPLGHHKCMQDIDLNAVMFASSNSLENPEMDMGCCGQK